MKKKKLVIYGMVSIGFLGNFLSILVYIHDICAFFEIREYSTPYETKEYKNFYPQNYTCSYHYASLFVQLTPKQLHSQKILESLSTHLNIPIHAFSIDEKVSTSGLPIFYCNLHICPKLTTTAICNGNLSKKGLLGNVDTLASFGRRSKKYFNLQKKLLRKNCLFNCAITWKALNKRQCHAYNQDEIYNLISYYYNLLFVKKISSLNTFLWSFRLFHVSSKLNDSIGSFQSPTYVRSKRSANNASRLLSQHSVSTPATTHFFLKINTASLKQKTYQPYTQTAAPFFAGGKCDLTRC